MSSTKANIFYHVPEDQDDPETPNVFSVPIAKQNIKLHHIHDSFPLKGTYIFRFKAVLDGSVAWLDLEEPEARIPLFKDKIYVKATRVSWNQSEKHHSHYKINTSNSKIQDKSLINNANNNNNSATHSSKNVNFLDNEHPASSSNQEVKKQPSIHQIKKNEINFLEEIPMQVQSQKQGINFASGLNHDSLLFGESAQQDQRSDIFFGSSSPNINLNKGNNNDSFHKGGDLI